MKIPKFFVLGYDTSEGTHFFLVDHKEKRMISTHSTFEKMIDIAVREGYPLDRISCHIPPKKLELVRSQYSIDSYIKPVKEQRILLDDEKEEERETLSSIIQAYPLRRYSVSPSGSTYEFFQKLIEEEVDLILTSDKSRDKQEMYQERLTLSSLIRMTQLNRWSDKKMRNEGHSRSGSESEETPSIRYPQIEEYAELFFQGNYKKARLVFEKYWGMPVLFIKETFKNGLVDEISKKDLFNELEKHLPLY
jgi:hypothetical protein